MTVVKITMPTKDDRLVEWEDCVRAFREKEKHKWMQRQFATLSSKEYIGEKECPECGYEVPIYRTADSVETACYRCGWCE
jgi:predicted RNA-binding Zn-ribbon protein involved in translation (DUF1610 family)